MVNSVFSASAIYYTATLKLHKGVIKQLDKYRRHCLWRGSDLNSKKPSKAAWPLICTPKNQGGLGVLDLGTHNDAMLLKFLHKFFSQEDIPWVKLIWFHYYNSGKLPGQYKKGSFWWRDIVKLLGKFKSMSSVIVAEGNFVLFWKDRWIGQPLDLTYPELFSFAKNGNATFKSVASNFEISRIFSLPLSIQAHQQLNLLHQSLSNRQIRDGVDTWVYCWGNSIFSTSKTYKFLSSGALAHPVFRWIWKSRCQMKHKVFFWLLLVNRLNTRGLLQRRGMILDSYTCDLCILQLLETNAHLFLQCNFDKACWNSIGVNYSSSVTVLQIFEKNQERPGTPFLHGDNHSFSLEYLAN
jgi:hypothetical protein